MVAALEQFARERQAGAVAADPLGGLQVVVAVGAAGMACLLRGLVKRPAQRGGGEDVPLAVELRDGDPVSELSQAGVAATSGAAVVMGV